MSLKSSEKGQHRKAKYAKCHWDFFSLPVLWLLPQRLLLSNLSSFVEAHNKEIMIRWCADLCGPASSLSCISGSQVRRRKTLRWAKRDTFTQGKQNQRATPYDAIHATCPHYEFWKPWQWDQNAQIKPRRARLAEKVSVGVQVNKQIFRNISRRPKWICERFFCWF